MYRYSLRKLRGIAGNYENIYRDLPLSGWEGIIEIKADFDTAFAILTQEEKKLVFDSYTWKIEERDIVFRKMRDYLNTGEYVEL